MGTSVNYLLVTPPYEATPNNRTEVRFDKLGRIDFKQMAGGASTQSQRFLPNGWKLYNDYVTSSYVEQGMYYPNYDRVGNRVVMQERTGGSSGVYTNTYLRYDNSNQLVNERRADVPGFNTTYVYDGAGNRVVQNASGVLTTYLYGSGNRLLQEVTGSAVTSYSYDANGNQTLINASGALTTYSWDGENRLKQVVQPDGTVEKSEYSHEGLRRKKQITSPSSVTTTTNFVWDGQSLLQERNGSNLLLAQYTWAPEMWDGVWSGGDLMDVLLLERRASTPGDMANGISRYHGEDSAYNTRLLIDTGGSVTDRWSYESFGEVFAHLGSGGTPFLFGGALGYYADASRRTYVRARHYDPTTGRWVSTDPIGFMGGNWNLFGYVGNMPVGAVDASGLQGWEGVKKNFEDLFNQLEKDIIELQNYGRYCGGDQSPAPGARRAGRPVPFSYDEVDFCCKIHDDKFNRRGCNVEKIVNALFGEPGPCRDANVQFCYCVAKAHCGRTYRDYSGRTHQKNAAQVKKCNDYREKVKFLFCPPKKRCPSRKPGEVGGGGGGTWPNAGGGRSW